MEVTGQRQHKENYISISLMSINAKNMSRVWYFQIKYNNGITE